MRSCLVDSCVWIAALFPGHRDHARAAALLRGATRLHTSDFVIDEVVSFILGSAQLPDDGARRRSEALRFMQMVEDAAAIDVLSVTGTHFGEAKSAAETYGLGLTLTDWTNILLMRENGIRTLLTFDRGFAGARNLPGLGFFRVVP
ncbi:MAG: PIN domain-containing protein [Euryarchaeota archaeon]|nr:PIN domain-containing protein [Euryarchaeota archaeon]